MGVIFFRCVCPFATSVVQGGVACGKIEGADPPALAKRVQELANEHVAEKGEGGKVDGVEPALQAKLKKIIRCEQGGCRRFTLASRYGRLTAWCCTYIECISFCLLFSCACDVFWGRENHDMYSRSCVVERPSRPLQAQIF